MTGAEALELHAAAQALLRKQAIALTNGEIDLAEDLGLEAGLILGRATQQVGEVDTDLRERLLTSARATASELAKGIAALNQIWHQRGEEFARATRDGVALKRYLPPTDVPPRFLDEKR